MTKEFLRRTWAEIHLDNIMHNLNLFKERLEGAEIMAVVKANAYGHGANRVSEMLEPYVAWFAVSNIREAINLREYGIKKPVLIFGYTPPDCAALINKYDLAQAVFSAGYAKRLNEAAGAAGIKIRTHLKIDTGMSRIGFPVNGRTENDGILSDNLRGQNVFNQGFGVEEEVFKSIIDVCKSQNLVLEGIFTHFACADDTGFGKTFTQNQFFKFTCLIKELEGSGIVFKYAHCSNSAASIHYPEMQCNLIRIGISLYGLTPDNGNTCLLPLKRGMTLKTVAAMVKTVPAAISVSYGGTYITSQSETLVTVPCGYADGLPRLLSNKGIMYRQNTPLKIVGRVCMDQTVLLSPHGRISEGDEITIFGYNSPRTTEDFAKACGTINYEVTCAVSPRVPRVYLKEGSIVAVDDYTP